MVVVCYLIGTYLFSWLLSKLRISDFLKFFIAFLISFAFFSISMVLDGNYADYTSLIIVGFIAIFLALLILLLESKIGKDSNKKKQ